VHLYNPGGGHRIAMLAWKNKERKGRPVLSSGNCPSSENYLTDSGEKQRVYLIDTERNHPKSVLWCHIGGGWGSRKERVEK